MVCDIVVCDTIAGMCGTLHCCMWYDIIVCDTMKLVCVVHCIVVHDIILWCDTVVCDTITLVCVVHCIVCDTTLI